MNKEEQAELFYARFLVVNCPLDSSITRSISKLAVNGLDEKPSKLTNLKRYSSKLFAYITEKKKDFSEIDCEEYLAWKIWQYKSEEPDTRIINSFCRSKAYLMATKFLTEMHKSTSRMKRMLQEIDECRDRIDFDYEKFYRLKQEEHQKAMEVYQSIYDRHIQALGKVDELIQKQLEGTKNA